MQHLEGSLRYSRNDSIIERERAIIPLVDVESLMADLSNILVERDEQALIALLDGLGRIQAEKAHE